MERDENRTWHECMRFIGEAENCQMACPIADEGYCRDLERLLPFLASKLDKKLSDKPLEDRDSILSATMEGIVDQLEKGNFHGEKAKFSTWAREIFKNKIADYFRKSEKFRQNVNISALTHGEEDGEETGAFEKMLAKQAIELSNTIKDGNYLSLADTLLESSRDPSMDIENLLRKKYAHSIVETLKKNIGNDTTGCARLFCDLFHAWEEGRKDQDVAEEYGWLPNTLAQKKRRCVETIQRLIEVA